MRSAVFNFSRGGRDSFAADGYLRLPVLAQRSLRDSPARARGQREGPAVAARESEGLGLLRLAGLRVGQGEAEGGRARLRGRVVRLLGYGQRAGVRLVLTVEDEGRGIPGGHCAGGAEAIFGLVVDAQGVCPVRFFLGGIFRRLLDAPRGIGLEAEGLGFARVEGEGAGVCGFVPFYAIDVGIIGQLNLKGEAAGNLVFNLLRGHIFSRLGHGEGAVGQGKAEAAVVAVENLEVVGSFNSLGFVDMVQVQVDVRRAGVVVLALLAAEVGEVAETRLALAEIELPVLNLGGFLGYRARGPHDDLRRLHGLYVGAHGVAAVHRAVIRRLKVIGLPFLVLRRGLRAVRVRVERRVLVHVVEGVIQGRGVRHIGVADGLLVQADIARLAAGIRVVHALVELHQAVHGVPGDILRAHLLEVHVPVGHNALLEAHGVYEAEGIGAVVREAGDLALDVFGDRGLAQGQQRGWYVDVQRLPAVRRGLHIDVYVAQVVRAVDRVRRLAGEDVVGFAVALHAAAVAVYDVVDDERLDALELHILAERVGVVEPAAAVAGDVRALHQRGDLGGVRGDLRYDAVEDAAPVDVRAAAGDGVVPVVILELVRGEAICIGELGGRVVIAAASVLQRDGAVFAEAIHVSGEVGVRGQLRLRVEHDGGQLGRVRARGVDADGVHLHLFIAGQAVVPGGGLLHIRRREQCGEGLRVTPVVILPVGVGVLVGHALVALYLHAVDKDAVRAVSLGEAGCNVLRGDGDAAVGLDGALRGLVNLGAGDFRLALAHEYEGGLARHRGCADLNRGVVVVEQHLHAGVDAHLRVFVDGRAVLV